MDSLETEFRSYCLVSRHLIAPASHQEYANLVKRRKNGNLPNDGFRVNGQT